MSAIDEYCYLTARLWDLMSKNPAVESRELKGHIRLIICGSQGGVSSDVKFIVAACMLRTEHYFRLIVSFLERTVSIMPEFRPKSLFPIVLALGVLCGPLQAARKPNVVLFMVDDMGWMDSTP